MFGSGLIFLITITCHNPDSDRKIQRILKWIISKRPFVDNFAMLTLFHWFLTENLVSDLISIAIDILLQIQTTSEKQRLQMSIDIVFIVLANIMILLKITLILVFMCIFGKPTSWNFFLFDGINPARVKLYFIHFIAYWLFLAVLVLVSDFFNLKIRVILLFLL